MHECPVSSASSARRGNVTTDGIGGVYQDHANAEIKTMINAFGCGFSEGYGNDFDITKLRYDKIIIMADAVSYTHLDVYKRQKRDR